MPVRDRLFTRIGTSDDFERNVSTFLMECSETSFILDRVTSQSLVLIDEFGRGTSEREGFVLAWATCERLLQSNAYTFFVTHYHKMSELALLYPRCMNFHMRACLTQAQIEFSYSICDGPSPVKTDYGMQLASACGMPEGVLLAAKSIKRAVGEKLLATELVQCASSTTTHSMGLLQRLTNLRYATTLDVTTLRIFLERIRLTQSTQSDQRRAEPPDSFLVPRHQSHQPHHRPDSIPKSSAQSSSDQSPKDTKERCMLASALQMDTSGCNLEVSGQKGAISTANFAPEGNTHFAERTNFRLNPHNSPRNKSFATPFETLSSNNKENSVL